ncbi:hypothetical protein [Pseudomonas cerasi]
MMKNKIVHFINSIELSHIMCIAVGVLFPIYADVLFLHDYDSSTTSAIMDTVMVIVAIYTIFKVKDWLTDKITEKGFEQANKYLTMYHEAKLKAELLHLNISDLHTYLEHKSININDPEYQKKTNNVIELHSEYRDHMLKLKSQLDILHVWNIEIHPEKKSTLQEILHNLFQFTVTSDKMIKICNDVNTMQRETDWGFYSLDFRTGFALTQILPLGWLTNWKNLFVVSNEKNQ